MKRIYDELLERAREDVTHLRETGQCRQYTGRHSDIHDAGVQDSLGLAERLKDPRYLGAVWSIIKDAALDGCDVDHYFRMIEDRCRQ